MNQNVFFSLLRCQLRRKKLSLLPCYNPERRHSNSNFAVVTISLHANQTEVLYVRRDKYLDLVKCLMKHEEAFPLKSDLLEQVMTSIAA